MLYVCMCSCMAVGVCSSSVVPLAVSTCMRTLYSIWHGGLGGVRRIQGCYLHVCTERAPLEQCLEWLVRAIYLYRLACTVLVPLLHASTGNVPTYPRLCSYCTCTIAQCVLYCTPCTMIRQARIRTRTVVVTLHIVYRAYTSCTVVWRGQRG